MNSINYEIESKSDFLTGMYLIARVPDGDVDANALHTIQEDCPDFILPFNYKSVNGQTEFTYKVGTLCKLQYFYGEISYAEYIALWRGILSPLLECGDWFMKPGSFVLCADYLYYDKTGNNVAYVYIPSLAGCCGYEAFNRMAVSIARNIKVSDPALENKVLRSIVNDFNPNEFLKMLLEHSPQLNAAVNMQAQAGEDGNVRAQPGDLPEDAPWSVTGDASGDAAADVPADVPADAAGNAEREHDGFRIFSAKGKRNKAKRNGFRNMLPGNIEGTVLPKPAEGKDITQETKVILSGTGLRCVGRAHFPPAIEVEIADGEIFTIGRHDLNAGRKRSSFEFEARTKAVSRRHAAIERDGPAYRIVDLSSSAGTYVNEKKLPPNTPARLEPGYRVSFGNLGADYVWVVK